MEDGKWMDSAKRIGVEDQWDNDWFSVGSFQFPVGSLQFSVDSFQLSVFGYQFSVSCAIVILRDNL
jgi:hypothetical protein